MKRRKPIHKPQTPKAIKIEVTEDDEYRLYKVWASGKQTETPFAITDDIAEAVEIYEAKVKEWKMKPDTKRIRELISNHNKKAESNEQSNFLKSGIF